MSLTKHKTLWNTWQVPPTCEQSSINTIHTITFIEDLTFIQLKQFKNQAIDDHCFLKMWTLIHHEFERNDRNLKWLRTFKLHKFAKLRFYTEEFQQKSLKTDEILFKRTNHGVKLVNQIYFETKKSSYFKSKLSQKDKK